MRFTRIDKGIRALRLLIALGNPNIGAALAGCGMSDADVDEGWTLLRALGPARLSGVAPPPTDDHPLAALEAWQNRWFGVARRSLLRRFPRLRAQLFLNLAAAHGPGAVITVGAFLARWDDMSAMRAPYEQDGREAVQLLANRGLTPAVIDDARALEAAVRRKIDGAALLVAQEKDEARLAQAESALWAWYLEWSELARTTIRDRRLLRKIGFLAEASHAKHRGATTKSARRAVRNG